MAKISVIGCGNMGGSIASALHRSGKWEVTCYDRDKARAEATGGKAAASIEEALAASDLIVLALKPQVLPTIYDDLAEAPGKSYISVCGGVPIEVISYKTGAENIARFMPNLAARAGKSVTAVAFSEGSDAEFRKTTEAVASTIGSVFPLPEHLFHAFIGLSGSGIAYVLEMVHAMAMGAVENGIPYPEASRIAADTLESAFVLLKESGKNPVELATRVCSAGGTTIKGMNALAAYGFDNAVAKAVSAATARSAELERAALERKEND